MNQEFKIQNGSKQ